MRRYFRVQPPGLGLNHRSETSNDTLADGLHVFLHAHEAESLSEWGVPRGGTPSEPLEVVVLEADRHWPNGDVEGVCVDGARALVVARIPHESFRAAEWED
jgi:hypothetical protein